MCVGPFVHLFTHENAASPHRGASIVKSPRTMRVFFGMETPLRGHSGGHTGAAPTVSFGQIARGQLISLGWIVCKWLFCLCGIVWKNMMEIGRGGACVPARVALQGRIHRSSPCAMHVFLVWKRRYADVRAGTQAPPLRFRLRELRVDVRPYAFHLGGLCVGV